jgi:endonuclease
VRSIVAHCEVVYTGRLATTLPPARRLLMLKSDGSVLLRADAGGCKLLNGDLPSDPH